MPNLLSLAKSSPKQDTSNELGESKKKNVQPQKKDVSYKKLEERVKKLEVLLSKKPIIKEAEDPYEILVVPNSNAEVRVHESGKITIIRQAYVGNSKYPKHLFSVPTLLFRKKLLKVGMKYKITIEEDDRKQ